MNAISWKKSIVNSIAGLLLAAVLCTAGAANPAWASGETWKQVAAMGKPRAMHTATLVDPGNVLVVGGYPGPYGTCLLDPSLYNPSTNTWSYAGKVANGGAYQTNFNSHTATLLQSGKVLIVGGITYACGGPPGGSILNTAELYDPASNSWSAVPHTASTRVNHTATLLANGKVLVTGGNTADSQNPSISKAEIYDPTTNTWSPAADMQVARQNHFAVRLPSGKVLVGSGTVSEYASPLLTTEIYDPANNTWTAAASMNTGHLHTVALLLPNGKVFVAGGTNIAAVQSAELYDPGTNTWTVLANIPTARTYNTVTLLKTGQVLFAGGDSYNGLTHDKLNAEVYTPWKNTWSNIAGLNEAHYEAAGLLLPSGLMFLSGGYDPDPIPGTYTNGVEVYQVNDLLFVPVLIKN